MLLIEYTDEYLEGEPGPNFYWRGTPDVFLRLLTDLHPLGATIGIEIQLNALEYIHVDGGLKVTLRSSGKGRDLCKKSERHVIMDLEITTWRRVLEKFLSISFEASHTYVEFDDLDLHESANIIVSSEA